MRKSQSPTGAVQVSSPLGLMLKAWQLSRQSLEKDTGSTDRVSFHSLRNQASRFDRWSMSAMRRFFANYRAYCARKD
jgi:hypothetical protein